MKVYEKIYNYYIDLMKRGALAPETKMPSLRECTKELSVSKTSAETAYLQLAADGYIYSVEKVGYFTTDLARKEGELSFPAKSIDKVSNIEIQFDFATLGADPAVSCLDLWRRYIKSALRQEDRLLSYSLNQGEEDLRIEIANYVRKSRNIICSPDNIIIGAGFQNLFDVLIPLLSGEKTVSFPTKSFIEGATSFTDRGYTVSYRDKEAHIINVTPAYMTKWGAVMPIKRRMELVEHAKAHHKIIIEDDYQNEFVFSSHPTPSLYALSGGTNVVYISSFSRVLLPSVRISFMILPDFLKQAYQQRINLYNQSASKAEQIALAQFIRDGHLLRHIRKMHRLYEYKRELLYSILRENLADSIEIKYGESGMEIGLIIPAKLEKSDFIDNGFSVNFFDYNEASTNLLLSCSLLSQDKIVNGANALAKLLKEKTSQQ